jgi:uncharacterized membrane protein YecN with MAPEG domain
MPLTPIYAALLAVLFIVLSLRIIRLRQRLGVSVGEGSNRQLRRAVRVHANFAEYVPIALLLLYFLEVHTEARGAVHALGIALLVGRILHAVGVSREPEDLRWRVAGVVVTFGVIALCACALLWHAARLASLQ